MTRHHLLLVSVVALAVVLYFFCNPNNAMRSATLRGVEKASRELWIAELRAEMTKGMSVADLTKADYDKALATMARARQAAKDAGANERMIRRSEASGRMASARAEAERIKAIAEKVRAKKGADGSES